MPPSRTVAQAPALRIWTCRQRRRDLRASRGGGGARGRRSGPARTGAIVRQPLPGLSTEPGGRRPGRLGCRVGSASEGTPAAPSWTRRQPPAGEAVARCREIPSRRTHHRETRMAKGAPPTPPPGAAGVGTELVQLLTPDGERIERALRLQRHGVLASTSPTTSSAACTAIWCSPGGWTPRPPPCSARASWACGPPCSARRRRRSAPAARCGRRTWSSPPTASTACSTAAGSTRPSCSACSAA